MTYAFSSLDELGEGPGIRKVRAALGVTAFGINVIVLPPGHVGFHHWHETQDELYFVHRGGRVEVEVEGETRVLGEGGLFHVSSTTPRKVSNPFGEEAVLLAIGGKDGYVARDGHLVDEADIARRASFGKQSVARNAVYLITGPMAAGKSTVAAMLASRFDRGVHVEGDIFRRSVVSGREEMSPDPPAEAIEQLRLRYRLAAAAADAYFDAGFAVALEDVAAGPFLGEYEAMIRSRPCHVVVLLPSVAAVAAREEGRADRSYLGGWTAERHHADFASDTPRSGIWLDTTEQTPAETVDEILARTSGGG